MPRGSSEEKLEEELTSPLPDHVRSNGSMPIEGGNTFVKFAPWPSTVEKSGKVEKRSKSILNRRDKDGGK